MPIEQPSLFAAGELSQFEAVPQRPASFIISETVLLEWKQRIVQYQQQIRGSAPVQQTSLFEAGFGLAPDRDRHSETTAKTIDPLSLPQQNTQFWRLQAQDMGGAALYFVIDYELSLLLYVGETVKANQRWKGEHDCKRYLLNYRQAHYHHQLPSQLGIAFWHEAPTGTRDRQRLESQLIYRWRSPFNKENWRFWGTPFMGNADPS